MPSAPYDYARRFPTDTAMEVVTPIIGDLSYLKLDQTTPQTVENGAPIFDAGLRSNGAIILKSGQKLIFDGA